MADKEARTIKLRRVTKEAAARIDELEKENRNLIMDIQIAEGYREDCASLKEHLKRNSEESERLQKNPDSYEEIEKKIDAVRIYSVDFDTETGCYLGYRLAGTAEVPMEDEDDAKWLWHMCNWSYWGSSQPKELHCDISCLNHEAFFENEKGECWYPVFCGWEYRKSIEELDTYFRAGADIPMFWFAKKKKII